MNTQIFNLIFKEKILKILLILDKFEFIILNIINKCRSVERINVSRTLKSEINKDI